ncbi:MAG: peptidase [Mycobacterium sp.]
MRRFTTSVVTERPRLGLLLLVELVAAAIVLIAHPFGATHPADQTPPAATHASLDVPTTPTDPLTLTDGRTVSLVALGGAQTAGLEARIWSELDGAADAVTSFWGDDWPRNVSVVLTGTDEEFRALASGDSDIAAATTAQRIVFAPGASTMSDASLRIVLRHELFHYAARGHTAVDAPRWLTEGVADYVGRPPTPFPASARASEVARLPTDADLDTPGAVRSLAYDRAWWFSRFVASRYGAQTLRGLYLTACGPGHPDQGTAIKSALGADTPAVMAAWRAWLSGQ